MRPIRKIVLFPVLLMLTTGCLSEKAKELIKDAVGNAPSDPNASEPDPSAQWDLNRSVDHTNSTSDICTDGSGHDTEIFSCINDLISGGQIAGFSNVVYDNRDGDHTVINANLYPGLTYRHGGNGAHSPLGANSQALAWSGDYSLTKEIAIIGNASLCYGTTDCSSVGRWLMSTRKHDQLENIYNSNSLYMHPEHHDHDDRDRLWYMTPYTLASQNSSGAEMDEISKLLHTTAAFKPDVFAKIMDAGLLAPTLNLIFRMARVETQEDYVDPNYSQYAHISAYDNDNNVHKMVRLANQMELNEIPPRAKLSLISETTPEFSEYLVSVTTPSAIARLKKYNGVTDITLVVSLEDSYDINGRPLTYHWVRLRGDASEVQIRALNPQASQVEITFHTISERAIPLITRTILSKLSVVGAFVHNGAYFSAPAYVTYYSDYRNQ